jgi:CBS domain-containing protein
MSTEVIALEACAPVEEALRVLVRNDIGGAPVVDGGRVVGVLSKSDLVDPRREAAHQINVREVMTPLVHYLEPDDRATRAIDVMLRERIHRVIVIDGGGQLAGLVTQTDILRAIQGARLVPAERADD